MGAGRVSIITVYFFNKYEDERCNIQEEHEPNQNSGKKKKKRIETKKSTIMKINCKITLTRMVSSEFQDQHKEMCKNSGFFK